MCQPWCVHLHIWHASLKCQINIVEHVFLNTSKDKTSFIFVFMTICKNTWWNVDLDLQSGHVSLSLKRLAIHRDHYSKTFLMLTCIFGNIGQNTHMKSVHFRKLVWVLHCVGLGRWKPISDCSDQYSLITNCPCDQPWHSSRSSSWHNYNSNCSQMQVTLLAGFK